MRFDATDLQLFLHACDSGGLTAAAERAHLTLTAASARVRGMEEQAGTPLLQRHSRGVRPTPAGETLVPHARAVLAQMQRLQDALAAHGPGTRARIRLLCNSAAAQGRELAAPLGTFLAAHPCADLQMEESTSHLTVRALREGLADLGIVSSAVDTEGLHCTPWRDDALVVLLPRGHALMRQRRGIDFAQLLEHPLIGTGVAGALHAHLSLQAARLGRSLRLRASVSHADAVQGLVAQGVGAAVLPSSLLGPRPRVAMRPLRDAWARRSLLLCHPHAPAPRPLVQALAAHLLRAA